MHTAMILANFIRELEPSSTAEFIADKMDRPILSGMCHTTIGRIFVVR